MYRHDTTREKRGRKQPTNGQWWNIRYIESNLGIKFMGKTSKDATLFINQHIGAAIEQRQYSQIRYF